ncbi:MAG TPA: hypothetical protein VL793_15735 [Patescibacteria group bacterium]|jgi:hypothetical protein|nr:hypothetical protein [Patescibacteria group bacterium]
MSAASNLFIAWLWIFLGFVSGLALGLFFQDENWLGGYTSFKRRLYRLAHISFFGLGAVNFVFVLTVRNWLAEGPLTSAASTAFVVGALTMPLSCVLMANFPRAKALFAVPVLSLLAGGTLTLIQLAKL